MYVKGALRALEDTVTFKNILGILLTIGNFLSGAEVINNVLHTYLFIISMTTWHFFKTQYLKYCELPWLPVVDFTVTENVKLLHIGAAVVLILPAVQYSAFQLDFLTKVPNIKDNSPHKHSMLYHVANMMLDTYPDCTNLHADFADVHKCAKVCHTSARCTTSE